MLLMATTTAAQIKHTPFQNNIMEVALKNWFKLLLQLQIKNLVEMIATFYVSMTARKNDKVKLSIK